MAKWLEQGSQCHEVYCLDLEVVSSNPGRVELTVHSTSVPSRTWTKQIYWGVFWYVSNTYSIDSQGGGDAFCCAVIVKIWASQRHVLSRSRGHGFEPQSRRIWRAKLLCLCCAWTININSSHVSSNPVLCNEMSQTITLHFSCSCEVNFVDLEW